MTATLCPDCGSPLPPDAPQGQCPRCLLQAGYDSLPEEPGPVASPQTHAPQTLSAPAPHAAMTRSYAGHARFQPLTVEALQAKIPNYEIQELIGVGGMGAVYKARQKGLGRLVAIKVLPGEISSSPDFLERFSREARALALLSHPHIVAVHDFGHAEGICYFVMEYVDGVNLRQALQAGKMDTRQALAIVPQICDALQFAHDEGVVHRDIKPENILIDKRGRVKIADFGLAKLLGPDSAGMSLTGTQQVMGTLRYMAPEQMSGAKEVDHRADIFSLGVVFYELLTGELPIGRFAPPSKKAAVDARLDEVVLRALEAEPALRYQQVSELKTGVEAAKQPATMSPQPAPMSPQARVIPAPLPEPLDQPVHDPRFWGTPVSLVLCALLTFFTLSLLLYFAKPVITMAIGPDIELINLGRQWRMGDTVDKIMVALVMMLAPLIAATLWAWWKYQSAPPGPNRTRRKEDRPAEAAGLSARSLADDSEGAPRLSKAALWGAVLIPVFVLSVIMLAAATTAVVVPVRVSSPGEPQPAVRPTWIMTIFLLPLLLVQIVGLLSPFITTILGVVAIGNIRQSRGRLYGLPLAVFDALMFPLLLLDLILFGAGIFLFAAALRFVMPSTPGGSLVAFAPLLVVTLLLLPLILVLDLYLIRLAWRAAASNLPGGETGERLDQKAGKMAPGKEPTFQPHRGQATSMLAIVLILIALGMIPLLLCGGVVGAYWLTPMQSVKEQMIEPVAHEHGGASDPTPNQSFLELERQRPPSVDEH